MTELAQATLPPAAHLCRPRQPWRIGQQLHKRGHGAVHDELVAAGHLWLMRLALYAQQQDEQAALCLQQLDKQAALCVQQPDKQAALCVQQRDKQAALCVQHQDKQAALCAQQ